MEGVSADLETKLNPKVSMSIETTFGQATEMVTINVMLGDLIAQERSDAARESSQPVSNLGLTIGKPMVRRNT